MERVTGTYVARLSQRDDAISATVTATGWKIMNRGTASKMEAATNDRLIWTFVKMIR